MPLLRNPKFEWPYAVITHLDNPENYAISTERWRYIHYVGGEEELYDIESDPYEWINLAETPASSHTEKLAEIRSLVPKRFASVHESQPGINSFKAELDLTPIVNKPAVASKASTSDVSMLIQNQTQKSIRLVWLDESGMRHAPVTIAKASRYILETFSGHTWILVDEENQDIGHIVASDKPARVVVQP